MSTLIKGIVNAVFGSKNKTENLKMDDTAPKSVEPDKTIGATQDATQDATQYAIQEVTQEEKCCECESTEHLTKKCPQKTKSETKGDLQFLTLHDADVEKKRYENKYNVLNKIKIPNEQPCVPCHICKKNGHYSTACPNRK